VAPDESTIPTRETQSEGEAKSTLALAWVFPSRGAPVHCLGEGRVALGRGADCAIRLDSPSVSRLHAEVYRQGPIYVVRDLGSTNGVYVDGQRIGHAPLRSGQVLRLGDFVAVIKKMDRGMHGELLRLDELAPGLFTSSASADRLEPLRLAARHDLPFELQGETGTGKEVLARSIHHWSGRKGPFYAVNCAALPAAMADGELFGYRKGAFTGAIQGHVGHLRSADRGTLFLDEVNELPLATQAKLLRALQEREVLPLGENRPVPIDVRIVTASQRPLLDEVQQGTFRADLHARLAGYGFTVAPLRERREEIPLLFAMFLHRYSGGQPPPLEPKLVERLALYDWPENVRELELVTKQLVVLHGQEPFLRRSFLPPRLLNEASPAVGEPEMAPDEDRRGYELTKLVAALRRVNGNVTKAAAMVGLSRQRAYRLMAGRSADELMEIEAATRQAISDEANGARET
jgi:DNA-binding NtrC family response regulator